MQASKYERDPRVPAVKIVTMRTARRRAKRGLSGDLDESVWPDFFALIAKR